MMEIKKPKDAPKKLPPWVYVVSFIVLLAFLGLVYWGLNVNQRGPIMLGQDVPAFTLTTFDGQSIHTADLSGKVILVNFWASWCKPCEQEAAELETVWRQYQPGGEVVFLGVDYVDTEPEAMQYLEKFGITFPNGPDLRTQISQMFRIRGVPETYVIDRKGKLAYVKIGPFVSVEEITVVLDELLAQ